MTSWEVWGGGVLRRPKVPAGVKFGKPSKKALAKKKRWEGSGEKSYFVLGKGHHHAIEPRAMVAVAKRSNGSGRVCIDTSPESLAAKREQVDGPTQIPWMNKYRMAYDLHDLHE